MSVRAPIEPPPIEHGPTLHEEDWTWWVECSCGWSTPVRELWWGEPALLLEHRVHVEEAAAAATSRPIEPRGSSQGTDFETNQEES